MAKAKKSGNSPSTATLGFEQKLWATADALRNNEEAELTFEEMPRDALFLAAKAHVLYRQRGGTRHGVLADFFVGAHAAVRRWPILTRAAGRYRGYFPTVELVTPGR